MVTRSVRFLLCLLAALWAGGAPAGADPLSLSGEVKLALSSKAASYLPIDIGALAERLCDPITYRPPEGMAKCHLIVPSPSGPPGNPTAAKGVVGIGGGMTTLRASSFNLKSEGVETSCGIWDFTLGLDPDVPQPESPLVFEENAEDPGRGVFAGVLDLSTILHLVNRETGQTADFPLRLGIGMAGPWASVPPEISADPLLLFGGIQDGKLVFYDTCIPLWVIHSQEDLEKLLAEGCQICWHHATEEQDNHTDGTMDN